MSEPHTNRVRASDAERDAVADRVRTAMGEGRLSLDEGEQRLAAVYASTYRDELPALTADLPPAEPASRERGGGGTRRFRSGRPRPAVPVFGLLVLGLLLTGLWAATASGPLWPVIVLGVLAFMLVKHGRRRHAWYPGAGHLCGRRESRSG